MVATVPTLAIVRTRRTVRLRMCRLIFWIWLSTFVSSSIQAQGARCQQSDHNDDQKDGHFQLPIAISVS